MRRLWALRERLPIIAAVATSVYVVDSYQTPTKASSTHSILPCPKDNTPRGCRVAAAKPTLPAVGTTSIEAVVVRTKVKTRDAPEAATDFSSRAITQRNITRPLDFIAQTPNMTAIEANNPGDLRITIRGDAQALNTDPPVAVVLDGVELTGATGLNNDLFDLQSISVVKGPQSFLYGRNAIAGAINITTQPPTNEFHGAAQVGFGNGDTERTSYMLSGPLIDDKLLFSAAFSYRNTDGFYTDTTTGKKVDPYQTVLGHGRLDWLVSPDLSIDFAALVSHTRAGATQYTSQSVLPGFQTAGERSSIVDANFAEPLFVSPVEDYSHVLDQLYSATVDYHRPWGDLHSVSAYEYEDTVFASANYPYPADSLATQYNDRGNTSWSEDFRFTSPATNRLQYIVGADGALIRQNPFLLAATSLVSTGTVVPAPTPIDDPANPTASFSRDELYAKAAGAYVNLSYRLLPKLILTAAGRYDYETKSDTDVAPDEFSATSGERRNASYYAFQPKLNLAYHFTPDVMGYAMYAQGYKAGGFNPAQTAVATDGEAPNSYPEEKAYDIEGGVKSQLFDRRVTLDATAFYTIKDNAQVFQFIPTGALNAVTVLDRTDSEGFELQGGWRISQAFSLQAALGYTHSTIGSDHEDPIFVGNRAPYVPTLSASASASYVTPLGASVYMVSTLTYQHWGDEYFSPANTPWTERNGLDFLDARIAFDYSKAGVELAFWAKNLADVRYNSDVIVILNDASDRTQATYLAPPRTFGGDLTYRF